ncbi:hypothetical protein ACFLZX_02360 [Nanoarchaeota archaeon]
MKKFLILIILIVLSSTVYGSFDAFSQVQNVGICQCSNQVDIITVTNTGMFEDFYSVTHTGSAARYISTVPVSLSIKAGESKQIYHYFNTPCDFSDQLELSTIITSNGGESKVLNQHVTANICENLYAETYDFIKTTCPCTPVTYNFSITNTGYGDETYSISLNKLTDFVSLSENPVSLKPGETRDIIATIDTPCEIFGKYDLEFTITASLSQTIATTPVNLEIEPCYDYDVTFGKTVAHDTDIASVPFIPYSKDYNLCNGELIAIPFLIKNTANVSNVFTASVQGSNYASIPYNQVSLESQQPGIMLIQWSPDLTTTGNFPLILEVTSARGLITKTYNISVNSKSCFEANLIVNTKETACGCISSDLPITIENLGEKDAIFNININGSEYITAEDSISIEAGSSANSSININPPCDQSGNEEVLVEITTGDSIPLDYSNIKLNVVSKESCFPLDIDSAKTVYIDYNENIIPIAITNTGSKATTFDVESSNVFTDIIEELTLKPGQREVLGLVTDFPRDMPANTYNTTVTLESEGMSYETNIRLKLDENKGFFGKLNNWVRFYQYYIFASVGLIIILVILLLIILSILPNKKKKEPVEKKEKPKKKWNLFKHWKIIVLILAIIIVLGGLGALIYLVEAVQSFLLSYWYYIIGGFVLLAAILILLHFNAKIFKRK